MTVGSGESYAAAATLTDYRDKRKGGVCPPWVQGLLAVSQARRLVEDVDGVFVPPERVAKGGRDGCAVPTGELADLLDRCAEQMTRAVALPGSRPEERQTRAASKVEWIAEQTRRRDPTGRGVHTRTIERILSERAGLTPLRTADALAAAVGAAPLAFYDGRLSVVENPRASKSARATARYVTASVTSAGCFEAETGM